MKVFGWHPIPRKRKLLGLRGEAVRGSEFKSKPANDHRLISSFFNVQVLLAFRLKPMLHCVCSLSWFSVLGVL